jgi:hypothetical protein
VLIFIIKLNSNDFHCFRPSQKTFPLSGPTLSIVQP